MATPLVLAQQVFSALNGNLQAGGATCSNAEGFNETHARKGSESTAFPADFSSLVAFLLSASALSNWFKLALFGSFLETCMCLVFHLYYKVYSSIFITARFDEDDSSYGNDIFDLSLVAKLLDPGIKDLLIDDARDFLESKSCLAGELGLDVYVISLSRLGLDDTALGEIISELPEKCIALREDIDAAFSQTLNRDLDEEEKNPDQPQKEGTQKKQNQPPPPSTSRITLSGLLNALDGVGAQEGRILFATTNKYSSLDPALCRPGRMDIHIEFKLASRYQARELYRCSASLIRTSASTNDSPIEPVIFSGSSHCARAPKLSHRKIASLADTFTSSIPEREFSMAALQGYLMAYKVRPFDAVKDVVTWVEKEQAERARKSKMSPLPTVAEVSQVGENNKNAEEHEPDEEKETARTETTVQAST
ncbi:hypothetical protein HYPSUDRAFT_208504 [Hypholoma sublateritium FD-334 SS-4]|uniref:Uncharacterized protein n=1 Tax=Hypholoma sublateritium (strain FD-334 SS-4) TaxID=945553 RepID=A0A0D2N6C9_HYPSF|nr:hypothetical protein HYPSUDRAFT_208504 [Hypholoma sublateritium FD-334 SS-4]